MVNNLKIVNGELHIGKDIYEVKYSDAFGRKFDLNLKEKEELLKLITKTLKQMDKIPDDLDGLKMDDKGITIGEREFKLKGDDQKKFLKITSIFDRTLKLELNKKSPPEVPPKPKIKIKKPKTKLKPIVPKSPVPGFKLNSVAMDGHCLFNAIGKFIPNFKGYQWLRNEVAKNLLEKKEEYKSYFGYDHVKKPKSQNCWTFEDYVADIKIMPIAKEERPLYNPNDQNSRRGWGGQIEIQEMQKMLNRPIVVYKPDNLEENGIVVKTVVQGWVYSDDPNMSLEEAKNNEDTIFIYYNGAGHYDALQREK